MRTEIKVVIEVQKVGYRDRGQDDAIETAIGTVDPARNRNNPITGRAALYWYADMRIAIAVRLVENKILAVGVIESPGRVVHRIDQPLAILVKDEQTLQLRQLTNVRG